MKKILLMLLAALSVAGSAEAAKSKLNIITPHKDFEVKVKSCKLVDDVVTIDLIFAYYGKSVTRIFVGSSESDSSTTALDDEAHKYADIRFGELGSELQGGVLEFNLPKNNSKKYQLQINGVDRHASKFMLIQLEILDPESDNVINKHIKLQNLKISK